MTLREREALKHGASVVHAQLTYLTIAIKQGNAEKAWLAWNEITAATNMIRR